MAIESWLANAPNRIIAVVDVTDTRCMQIAREYAQVEVMPIDVPASARRWRRASTRPTPTSWCWPTAT
jgi:hypothetical protein